MGGDFPDRVCLVTTSHLCSNPRLVKEADALSEAGCRVEVVGIQTLSSLANCDAKLSASRPWKYFPVAVTTERPLRFQCARGMRLICSSAPEFAWSWGAAEIACAPGSVLLGREVDRHRADLYSAHNLGALPAAWRAAGKTGARLGFDAEDFHSGELPETPENLAAVKRTRWLERRYLPACDYVTASSAGIARVYAETCGIPEPTTILNVFPLSEAPPSPVEADFEPRPSLYWFSQTIGPDRGLEDAVRALGAMRTKAYLHLRGTPSDDCWDRLVDLAARCGAEDRIRLLSPGEPHEMLSMASRHDIGLALEQRVSPNREICVTNKLFTYLGAGVPVVATATEGQREICRNLTSAVSLYAPGDWRELAALLDRLLEDPATLARMRTAAWRLARERYNWDFEKEIFLGVVGSVFSSRRSAQILTEEARGT